MINHPISAFTSDNNILRIAVPVRMFFDEKDFLAKEKSTTSSAGLVGSRHRSYAISFLMTAIVFHSDGIVSLHGHDSADSITLT